MCKVTYTWCYTWFFSIHTFCSIYQQSVSSEAALRSLRTGVNSVVWELHVSIVHAGPWTWLGEVSQRKVMTLPSKDYERGIAYTRPPLRWTGTESHQWLWPKTQPAKKNTEAQFNLLHKLMKFIEIIMPEAAFFTFSFWCSLNRMERRTRTGWHRNHRKQP